MPCAPFCSAGSFHREAGSIGLLSSRLGYRTGSRGCRGTLLSFKPRARVGRCPAPPSPLLSTLTSEDCKYLVPQRGSSPSSSRVAFFFLISWFCIFQKFPIWKGKSSRKRRVTSLQLGCSRTLAYTRVWGREKNLYPKSVMASDSGENPSMRFPIQRDNIQRWVFRLQP